MFLGGRCPPQGDSGGSSQAIPWEEERGSTKDEAARRQWELPQHMDSGGGKELPNLAGATQDEQEAARGLSTKEGKVCAEGQSWQRNKQV